MPFPGYISEILFENGLDPRSYLNDLPVIRFLSKNKQLSFSSKVTFFVGENGTGKSTLLEAIAVAYGFNAEGGTRNFNFSTNQTHSELFNHIRIAKRGDLLRLSVPQDRIQSFSSGHHHITVVKNPMRCAPSIGFITHLSLRCAHGRIGRGGQSHHVADLVTFRIGQGGQAAENGLPNPCDVALLPKHLRE